MPHLWTPRRLPLICGVGSVALLAQYSFSDSKGTLGLVLYGAAAIGFGLLVRPLSRTSTPSAVPDLPVWPTLSKLALVAAALLTVVLVVLVDPAHLSNTAWALQFGAIALLLLAGLTADHARSEEAPIPMSPIDLSIMATRLLLGVILVGGIWLRFRSLGSVPLGLWSDEAELGLLARRISEEGYRPVFGEAIPAYDGYLVALLFKWFGESITTVRALSAIGGAATILAGYLVGRELFGRSGGLVVAFLIAFTRWPLTLSRIGMNNVMVPLFVLLFLGLVLRGRRRQSGLDFALAGVSAGAGILFYSAALASVAAIGTFAVYLAWTSDVKRTRGLLYAVLAISGAVVVLVPLAKFMVSEPDRYFSRTRNTAIWSEAGLEGDTVGSALRRSLRRYLPMTSYVGDPNGRHNIPGEPMLPPLLSGLSILGLGTIAGRIDKWLTVLVVIWLPLAFVPGVLSLPWEAPNSLRAIAVQPVAFVLATAAIMAIARTVVTGESAKRVLLSLLGVTLVLTALADVGSYFDAQRDRGDVSAVHSTAETIAAETVATSPQATQVAVVAFLQESKQQQFLSPDAEPDGFFGSDSQLPLFVPPEADGLFLTTHEAFDIGDQAEQLYPSAEVDRDPEGLGSGLVVVRVPADDIAASLGWSELEDGSMSAGLIVDESGDYQFRLADQSAVLVIDGQQVSQCETNPAVSLAAGLHIVSVTGSAELPGLEWIPSGSESWRPVPEGRLVRRQSVPGGLVASHFANPDDLAVPTLVEVDGTLDLRMHVLVLPRPYRTIWTGGLDVMTSGSYEFFHRASGELEMEIDDEVVLTNDGNTSEQSTVVDLDEGIHPISVSFLDEAGFSEVVVRWRRAGSSDVATPIGPTQLQPWSESSAAPGCY